MYVLAHLSYLRRASAVTLVDMDATVAQFTVLTTRSPALLFVRTNVRDSDHSVTDLKFKEVFNEADSVLRVLTEFEEIMTPRCLKNN